DPTIAGPVERYKTLRLAQDGNIKFFGFLKQIYSQQNHNSLPRYFAGFTSELYRGLPVTVAKKTLMNVAFFSVKPWADFIAKPYKQDYPLMSVAFTSLAPAIGAAAVGAPLDVVKTLTQHQTGATKGIIPLLRLVVQNTGFRGLFAGVGARFGLITFGYSLNGLFLNLFEQNRQHPTAPPSTQATHHSPNEVEDLTERLGSLSIDTKVDDLTKQLDALSIKEPQASTQAAPNTYLVKKSNPTSHEKDLTTQTSSLDNKSSKPK
ncbi:MAG: MC/SLC25 family protein, partial [Candidatus Berkiella sp.]